ncbi:polyprenyl synthetase family protein [Actinomadura sp. CNU-125]|uniref:polyprenyl synthetase family protein n=1 Tax=Actinomadura sp. CNU-125 TaxID=1904961 RepID=UPI0021CCF41A|nr:polyprenyl synthetase family protein [Actinomadura sp. CNU-125]
METDHPALARDLCGPLRARVDTELAAFLDGRLRDLGDETTAPLFRLVREFVLHGGKRLRPLLCYWGWRAAGGADCAEIVRAASALEIFHAFCLIHDDIMDDSALRRGRTTLHQALTDRHTAHHWRGDPRRFGVATAILLGDLCMTWADELLYTSGLAAERLAAARPYYHRMRAEVCYGQHLDIIEQAHGPTTAERSMRVLLYKSAKYTVERPLQVGGALAGTSPALLAAFSTFGVAVGEAFQLRDDVLGAFGDPDVTGKSDIDDFRDGKPTVLIAHAVEHATAAQRRLIRTLHGSPLLDEDGADRLREILVDTGALTAVEGMIKEREDRAVDVLTTAPITEPARLALTRLAGAATRRTA